MGGGVGKTATKEDDAIVPPPQATESRRGSAPPDIDGPRRSADGARRVRKRRSAESNAPMCLNGQYQIGRVLGQGAFGTVNHCIRLKDSKHVAIKCIPESDNQEYENLVLNEVECMKRLDHSSVVKFHEYAKEEGKHYIVTELVPGGELFHHISRKVRYTEWEAEQVLRMICAAISHCHERRVIYRDMKPENILLTTPSSTGTVKLCDFGLAAILGEGQQLTDVVGTAEYMAPEMVAQLPYGLGVDVWAVGVTAYMLLSGYLPFRGESEDKIFTAIRTQELVFDDSDFGTVSDDAKDFIRCALCKHPTARPSALQLSQHRWFMAPQEHLETHLLPDAARNLEMQSLRLKKTKALVMVKASARLATVGRYASNTFLGARSLPGSATAGGGSDLGVDQVVDDGKHHNQASGGDMGVDLNYCA